MTLCSLKELNKRLEKTQTLICLHGTDDLPDSLFQECIALKCTKVRSNASLVIDPPPRLVSFFDMPCLQINVNSWVRDPYMDQIRDGLIAEKPLPDIYEAATEAGAQASERMFRVYGCVNKA